MGRTPASTSFLIVISLVPVYRAAACSVSSSGSASVSRRPSARRQGARHLEDALARWHHAPPLRAHDAARAPGRAHAAPAHQPAHLPRDPGSAAALRGAAVAYGRANETESYAVTRPRIHSGVRTGPLAPAGPAAARQIPQTVSATVAVAVTSVKTGSPHASMSGTASAVMNPPPTSGRVINWR